LQSPLLAFTAGLEAKDKQSCVKWLHDYSGVLTETGSAFEWLKNLLTIGLTSTEIVELLFEEAEQSPWICYELVLPAAHDTTAIDFRSDYIQPTLPQHSGDHIVSVSEPEFKRRISELCGLGGIIPTPFNRTLWTENAVVWSPDRPVSIYYGSVPRSAGNPRWDREVLGQCCEALDRVIKVFRWLQLHD
jgi:hypothetical protein